MTSADAGMERDTGNMVESVARAIVREEWQYHAGPERLLELENELWRKQAGTARAAIEAIRNAPIRMSDAGGVIHEIRGDPQDVLRAILDAALRAGEKGE